MARRVKHEVGGREANPLFHRFIHPSGKWEVLNLDAENWKLRARAETTLTSSVSCAARDL